MTKEDIVVEAYSPLTEGVNLNDPELLKLTEKLKIPKTEILAKWAYLQGSIVLIKTAKKERIKEKFEILPVGGSSDPLEDETNLGKIDLDVDLLDALDKFNTVEVLCWGNMDPTQYHD